MLVGIDISASSTGYCYGAGEAIPRADAWLYEAVGDDLGRLAHMFRKDLNNLFDRIKPTGCMYEKPILRETDRVGTLRRTYGMGMLLEDICLTRGIAIREQNLQQLKKRLTGNHQAKKVEMVEAAKAHGLILPKTYAAGMKDAADAFAAWQWAVDEWAPHLSSRWPPIRNGGLL